jgi:hypothetical protein
MEGRRFAMENNSSAVFRRSDAVGIPWTELGWTDRILLIVLCVYPLAATLRAWTNSEDFILILWAVAVLGGLVRGRGWEEARQWIGWFANPLGYLSICLIAYAFTTFAWSIMTVDFSQVHALKRVGMFAVATVVAKRLEAIPNEGFHQWFAAATAIGLVVVGIDGLTGYKLLQFFSGPAIDGRINPNAIALSLLLWPSLAALAAADRKALAALLWLLAGAVLINSPSQAAMVGYAAGTGALLLAWMLPRATVWLATAAALGGLLLAPLLPRIAGIIANFLPDRFLVDASAVPRIEIWSAYAKSILSAPIFGQGALSLGKSHPHNFPLQLWVEFGAIGAALGASLLLAAGIAFLRMEGPYRPYALAYAVAVYVNAYVGYGMWEIPFLSIMLMAVLTVVHGYQSVGWVKPRLRASER